MLTRARFKPGRTVNSCRRMMAGKLVSRAEIQEARQSELFRTPIVQVEGLLSDVLP